MKRLLVIITALLLFSSICIGKEAKPKVKITLHNNTEVSKIYRMNWVNHPYGCYVVFGRLKCDFDRAVGELRVDKTSEIELEVEGDYCVEWDNTASHLRTEDSKTRQCIGILEEGKEYYVTPNSVEVTILDKKASEPDNQYEQEDRY